MCAIYPPPPAPSPTPPQVSLARFMCAHRGPPFTLHITTHRSFTTSYRRRARRWFRTTPASSSSRSRACCSYSPSTRTSMYVECLFELRVFDLSPYMVFYRVPTPAFSSSRSRARCLCSPCTRTIIYGLESHYRTDLGLPVHRLCTRVQCARSPTHSQILIHVRVRAHSLARAYTYTHMHRHVRTHITRTRNTHTF